jgi:hypothetical protein
LRDRYTAPAAKQVKVENGRWKVIVEGCVIQAMENNRLQDGWKKKSIGLRIQKRDFTSYAK